MIETHRTSPSIPAFLIADHRAVVAYGLGMARPGGHGLGQLIAQGYLVRDQTIAGLAWRLGVDGAALAETIANMNRFASTGVDEEFRRGSTAYQRNLGDPRVAPNPTLGPVARAPFYGVRLFPGDIGASTGLVTDAAARVLRDGVPISGLYAIGNDMNSVMAGAYPAPGITLGPAIAFAYAAIKHVRGMA
jgi:succinate dehydrogenase/fumarate reductase flavoprotein subunit